MLVVPLDLFVFFLMIRRPPRSTLDRSSAASDVYKRQVLNHPGTYAEFTATAIIGFALQRGLDKGWIKGSGYRRAVDQAWLAVNSRTSFTGTFIDVCESTARQASNEDYIKRMAILGPDPRAGGMAMMFATERMEASRR